VTLPARSRDRHIVIHDACEPRSRPWPPGGHLQSIEAVRAGTASRSAADDWPPEVRMPPQASESAPSAVMRWPFPAVPGRPRAAAVSLAPVW